ncbi:MAG: ABC transporter permease subunit [Acutalibacteraceae bacterium]
MFNGTLYKYEMKGSWKLLLIFAAILTMYITMIIGMYDPEMSKMLDDFAKAMPDLMSAVGMKGGAATLLGFMSSYLYGMLLLAFPMVFLIIRANALIAKYVDRGSMVNLLAAPVKRRSIAFTQMKVLASCIFLLLAYITVLQIIVAQVRFQGELNIEKLILINIGLFCLQFFIASICFFASCLFSDTKHSIALGAGLPVFMYVVQMIANMGGELEKAKYFTFFTLFNPDALIAGDTNAVTGIVLLFFGGLAMFAAAITVFSKKDLYI